MTTLILVRHGESKGNITRTFCGHTDVPLTDKGKAQAECTAKYLDRYPIDIIYSSSLKRAMSTAEPTANRRGLPIIPDDNLREIFAGDWEAIPFDQLSVSYPDSYGIWSNDIGNSYCDGGESVTELQARIASALGSIVSKNRGKTVAVFTHATPIRTMGCLWQGIPLTQMQNATDWPTNASITIAKYDDQDSAQLISYGENTFLSHFGYTDYDS